MKELTAIKLINWHYFTNETISIKGSVMFTGENGSGKSTILDAIQYVLVADLRFVKFNVSAHDDTKRDILGYLRCKTGNDSENGQKYRRSGDVTSYIVLEFYDTIKEKYFLAGAIIDSYSDNISWKSNFFKLEDCMLDESLFFENRRPRNIRDFKARVQSPKNRVYATAESYRSDILVKFGSLGERFFTLFVKAISFKPITDIRSFVYSYVLDEKSINIEVMKDNFRRYREFSELVQQTKEKLERLENIRSKYKDMLLDKERGLIQDYLVKKASMDDVAMEMDKTIERLNVLEGKLQGLQLEIETLNQKGEALDGEYNSYRDALASNSTFQLIEKLNMEIEVLKKEQSGLNSDMIKMGAVIKKEIVSLEGFVTLAGEVNAIPADVIQSAASLKDSLALIISGKSRGEALPEELDTFKGLLDSLSGELKEGVWKHKTALNELVKEEQSLKDELRDLKNKKFTYDPKVTELRSLISEKLKEKTGMDIEPKVLCELLEVVNEGWQDAVEGFLNTQRFDLIIDPEYFDQSLEVYEKYKRERRISGVGLVNTAKVMEYSHKQTQDSLAEEVVSSNRYAKAYVNQLMGNVIKCRSEQQLKNFSRSITPTCMTYMNNTARQINFKVYEIPFIGERAFVKQIEKKEQRLAELLLEKASLLKNIKSIEQVLESIKGKDEPYFIIKDKIKTIVQLKELEIKLKVKTEELLGIDTSAIDEIKQKLEAVELEKKRNKESLNNAIKRSGELGQEHKTLNWLLEEQKVKKEFAVVELEKFTAQNDGIIEKCTDRYEKERRDRSPSEIAAIFTVARKGIETSIGNKHRELLTLKSEYNTRYHFWARADLEDIKEYEEEYSKLMESELPEYEEKINISKKESEEEFKEHFIYKLKENITSAKNEFDILNDALKDIQFGSDRYRFTVAPEPAHRKFYDMIMDEELFEGHSLFDTVFRDKHREAMDELFDRIINQPDEMVAKSISEYTDYRTFLEYDIKITHSNGETSTFSKVCREKSGGETQTPYYVAIVASFCQLYRIKTNKDSIRLMMFDEAFNRMDSDRIENTLKFMNELGMQVIIAAPTDKCEYITPMISTTMLAIRDGHYSWIEDYKKMKNYAGALVM